MTLPHERPRGLRTEATSGTWWRIDRVHPDDWDWSPFPAPLHRFDSAAGLRRLRYAGRRPTTSALETFHWLRSARGTTELVREHLDTWLVRLDGPGPRALPLTVQENLRVLDLDDRISTGRTATTSDPLLHRCWELSDAVHRWWPDEPMAIRFRSRVHPSSTNLAFPAWDGPVEARRLGDARRLLTTLTLQHGFRIRARLR